MHFSYFSLLFLTPPNSNYLHFSLYTTVFFLTIFLLPSHSYIFLAAICFPFQFPICNVCIPWFVFFLFLIFFSLLLPRFFFPLPLDSVCSYFFYFAQYSILSFVFSYTFLFPFIFLLAEKKLFPCSHTSFFNILFIHYSSYPYKLPMHIYNPFSLFQCLLFLTPRFPSSLHIDFPFSSILHLLTYSTSTYLPHLLSPLALHLLPHHATTTFLPVPTKGSGERRSQGGGMASWGSSGTYVGGRNGKLKGTCRGREHNRWG